MTHPDCQECCRLNRCHFCPDSAGCFSAEYKGHTYWACYAHKEAFETILNTDPRGNGVAVEVFSVSKLLN